ncbi:oxysterol-binding protein-related protein 8 isoform X2 [Chrysoperla carnea]|uniref:oxysterol-binding protein-related protein 8 isoform X2 n=1 Tax=Chrysoperla carnea TaxID=189513 RepID=UPI001D08188D|nr:oxysterol-binding protein-related protein 8 isoform X2 [Chrysoperla carnea]
MNKSDQTVEAKRATSSGGDPNPNNVQQDVLKQSSSQSLHPIINSSATTSISGPLSSQSTRSSTTTTGPDSSFSSGSRSTQQILMPRLPSSDSLNYSTGPGSPGISNDSPRCESTTNFDKSAIKLSRKESYKAQRKHYRKEKKRVANEVATSLKDSSVVVLADWLKVRGTLKTWTKLWCILKPGLLLLYKSPKVKSNHWVGTVLLNACQVIERPSKKDGFCFKLFHPLDQSIWAPRGPEKETIGAVVQPLPTSYLIFRAPSQAAGKCWLDALELALRTSSVLVRSMSNKSGCESTNHETQWSEADYEKHFTDHDLNDGNQTDNGNMIETLSAVEVTDSESENSVKDEELVGEDEKVDEIPLETPYVVGHEDEIGTGEQTEELAEEHKSLIWFLVKQVRPGMDLSKVVLPTFILEPRSFLDKLSDAYYHADILSTAVLENDPYNRMKLITKWYLSGFYKKPKGLKKPYNPILGETFRCYWQHPKGSRTFYIAEQVSHHPPVSAFYVTNRQEGFSISCSILAKSKFYGNSTSAILDGIATLSLLPRGEDYTMTVPYAHCKGILMGTLSMELGGKVSIECEKTGYRTELEFRLKPFLGGSSDMNYIHGRIKLGKETLATIDGYWDGQIRIKERKADGEQVFFESTTEVRHTRLPRYVVPLEHQTEYESERLWQHVSAAIQRDDQVAATEEKTILEEAQRSAARERLAKGEEWIPKHFQLDPITHNWIYKAADSRPWDVNNDVYQFEYQYDILTKTRHPTPVIRTSSISYNRPAVAVIKAPPRRQKLTKQSKSLSSEVRESSESDGEGEFHSDSSSDRKLRNANDSRTLLEHINRLEDLVNNQGIVITSIVNTLDKMERNQQQLAKRTVTALKSQHGSHGGSGYGIMGPFNIDTICIILLTVVLQCLFQWLFTRRTILIENQPNGV